MQKKICADLKRKEKLMESEWKVIANICSFMAAYHSLGQF